MNTKLRLGVRLKQLKAFQSEIEELEVLLENAREMKSDLEDDIKELEKGEV